MRKCLVATMVAVMIGGVAMTASAEVYRYADGNGQICFVDDISKVPKKYRSQLGTADDLDEVNVVPSPAAPVRRTKAPQAEPKQAAARRFSDTVELYVTEWCPHCRRAEAYLRAKGIPYAKHDIEKDPAAKRSYEELGGGGVPLIVVGSHRMSGFNPKAIEYYLSQ